MRTYERRLAERAGHPAWVVKFAYSPAARRCVALLMAHGALQVVELAQQGGYAHHTVTIALNALKRIGRVERVQHGMWRIV